MLKYFFVFLLVCQNVFANPVIKVIDGDTIYIYFTENNETIKVRLQCADAPECGKSYGKKGKSQYIGDIDIGYESYKFTGEWFVKNAKKITLECKKKDKYGRSVCYVVANDGNCQTK